MTQPPYVPSRDDDNTRSASSWPTTASEQADTELFASQFPDPAYTGDVSSVAVGDQYGTGTGSSTKDVAKDQAGEVKDTAVQQGQQVAGVAKEQAGQVKDTAVEQGQHVAGVAKEQVSKVAAEASSQAKDLLSEGLSEARGQLATQQKRLADGVHSLADELGSMGAGSEHSGFLSGYAQQASRGTGELAHWLENAEPSDVLDELRTIARRRPALFLGASALTGALIGRLTRGIAANAKQDHQAQLTSGSGSSYSSGSATGTTGYATDYAGTSATSGYGTSTTTSGVDSPYSQDYTTTTRPDYVEDVDQTGARYGSTGRDGVL